MNRLFSPVQIGNLKLSNHMVMAPMTRSRAVNNIPNKLMGDYYAPRATAGLIVTEGPSPSPNGLAIRAFPVFSISNKLMAGK